MSIAEMLLPEFDQEMASTRKLLECFPEGDPTWKPHQKSMSIARLAGHVAELPSWAANTINLNEMHLTSADYKPYAPATRRELLADFDKNVTEARAAIAGATDAHLNAMWTMTYNGQKIIDMPRAAVLRGMFMSHLIHHRAQLGVYFRLRDIAIPGMYGPSADQMT